MKESYYKLYLKEIEGIKSKKIYLIEHELSNIGVKLEYIKNISFFLLFDFLSFRKTANEHNNEKNKTV